jgi:hypothetical protein
MIAIVPVTCTPTFGDCVIKCGKDGSCPNEQSCSNGFCTNHGFCDHGSPGAGEGGNPSVPGSAGQSAGALGSTHADGGREASTPSGGRGNRDATTASGGAGGTRPDASLDSSVGDGSAPFDAADAHRFDAKAHDARDASLDAADGSTQKPADYRYTDRTGKITINVRTCGPIVLTDAINCYPPDDFVLVGGGAEILDNPGDPGAGAVLARSSPSSGCVYWAAEWLDRDPEHPKKVRGYSISIRLESRSRPGTYIRADELAQVRSCVTHKYPADGNTYAAAPQEGHQLIGGGVAATEFPSQVALVQSYPFNGNWSGSGVVIDPRLPPTQIRITTIGLPSTILDFGNLETHLEELTVSCGLGDVCTSTHLFSSLGGVVTSVGGIARSAGFARYLSALVPLVETNGQVTAGMTMTTRDFSSSDTSDVQNQSALISVTTSE